MTSMACESILSRKLLWDEISSFANPSELSEIENVVGRLLISKNEELQTEIRALASILAEFQQRNDNAREALIARRRTAPEPPGRTLLLKNIQLLLQKIRLQNRPITLQSKNDQDMLDYVLQSLSYDGDMSHPEIASRKTEEAIRNPRRSSSTSIDRSSPLSPTLLQEHHCGKVGIYPNSSASRRRLTTTATPRPCCQDSTLNATSNPAVLQKMEIPKHLSVDTIWNLKEDIRNALAQEEQQLLEDIDFIQECLEMEKDLADNDCRNVSARQPPPLNELKAFARTLEATVHKPDEAKEMEEIFNGKNQKYKTNCSVPVRSAQSIQNSGPKASMTEASPIKNASRSPSRDYSTEKATTTSFISKPSVKVLKVRSVVQQETMTPMAREASMMFSCFARFTGVSYCFLQLVDTIKCIGPSMLPTLNRDGDIVVLDKITPRFRSVGKGEVVIAKSVTNPKHTVCKRIIAEEGDTVCVRSRFSTRDVEFHKIPKGHVWLEGDNKYDSHDSRYYGPVPVALIQGRVLMRIWPLNQTKWIAKEFSAHAFREI